VFDPLDLAIIDRVYDAAWAQLEAREPFRDKERDGERQDVLRKLIMDDTGTTTIEFDALYDKVLADMPQSLPAFTTFKRLKFKPADPPVRCRRGVEDEAS
jgi:hypothetical protein